MFHRRCDVCGRTAPVLAATYLQNTGMLVMRQSKRWSGNFCRSCSARLFWRATLHTFFLGWWGTISLFLNFYYVANDLYFGLRTLFLSGAGASAAKVLAGERDYALNLLKTKDDQTVVDVLVKQTGAPPEEVTKFVLELRRELATAA